MSALLAVLAGTARLSRRDRAALTLALESLRRRRGRGYGDKRFSFVATCESMSALSQCDNGGAADDLRRLVALRVDTHQIGEQLDGRLYRARLALLLRLVLRCDAATREVPGADPPPAWRLTSWLRDQDSTVMVQRWERLEDDPEHDPRDSIERIVPLWCQAPPTRAR